MIDDERVRNRAAGLLPEEVVAGSDDPEAQAAAILRESDEREAYLEPTADLRIDHRTSEEAAQ